MTLGQRIEQLRARTGMSQAALAALVGVDKSSVSHWIDDRWPPGYENLCRLAAAFGMTLPGLFHGVVSDEKAAG